MACNDYFDLYQMEGYLLDPKMTSSYTFMANHFRLIAHHFSQKTRGWHHLVLRYMCYDLRVPEGAIPYALLKEQVLAMEQGLPLEAVRTKCFQVVRNRRLIHRKGESWDAFKNHPLEASLLELARITGTKALGDAAGAFDLRHLKMLILATREGFSLDLLDLYSQRGAYHFYWKWQTLRAFRAHQMPYEPYFANGALQSEYQVDPYLEIFVFRGICDCFNLIQQGEMEKEALADLLMAAPFTSEPLHAVLNQFKWLKDVQMVLRYEHLIGGLPWELDPLHQSFATLSTFEQQALFDKANACKINFYTLAGWIEDWLSTDKKSPLADFLHHHLEALYRQKQRLEAYDYPSIQKHLLKVKYHLPPYLSTSGDRCFYEEDYERSKGAESTYVSLTLYSKLQKEAVMQAVSLVREGKLKPTEVTRHLSRFYASTT